MKKVLLVAVPLCALVVAACGALVWLAEVLGEEGPNPS